MWESLKVRQRRRSWEEGGYERHKEVKSLSVGVRAHTDRCLRCESLLGSEHHWDTLLYPDGDGVTDAPWECEVEYKSLLQTPSNTYSFHLMDPSPALFTPLLKYFTQVIYKMSCVCVTVQFVFIHCVSAWMCVCVRAAVSISVFALFCLHLRMRVYVDRCVCTCACACDCVQLCTHLFICFMVHVCVGVCVCIHVLQHELAYRYVCVMKKEGERGHEWTCICVCVCDNKDISDKVEVGLLLSLGISQEAQKQEEYNKMQCIIPTSRLLEQNVP